MQPGVIYEYDHSLSFRSIHEFRKTIMSTTNRAQKAPRERQYGERAIEKASIRCCFGFVVVKRIWFLTAKLRFMHL